MCNNIRRVSGPVRPQSLAFGRNHTDLRSRSGLNPTRRSTTYGRCFQYISFRGCFVWTAFWCCLVASTGDHTWLVTPWLGLKSPGSSLPYRFQWLITAITPLRDIDNHTPSRLGHVDQMLAPGWYNLIVGRRSWTRFLSCWQLLVSLVHY